jgi:hypothetical protein
MWRFALAAGEPARKFRNFYTVVYVQIEGVVGDLCEFFVEII